MLMLLASGPGMSMGQGQLMLMMGARAADAHDASFGARNGHAQGELMLVLLALDSA